MVLDIRIPPQYLYHTTYILGGAILCLLLFIIFYGVHYVKNIRRSIHLASIYSSFIAEVIICETEEELLQTMQQPYIQSIISQWLPKPLGRTILVRELIKIHKGMAGAAAGNLEWLYTYLELQRFSLKKLASKKWNHKAGAIQELAEMGQKKYLTKIYRETNHVNIFVRTEAQVAVVKLTGFEGLRFLNVIHYPITEWQQICLLQQLPAQDRFQWDKVTDWLQSKNNSVITFALKLIEAYQRYELHDAAVTCLQHNSVQVRMQAVQTLKIIGQATTAHVLEKHFFVCTKEEQLVVLAALPGLITSDQFSFLKVLCSYPDGSIRHEAKKLMELILPVGYNSIFTTSGSQNHRHQPITEASLV